MPTISQFLSSKTNRFGLVIIALTALQGLLFKFPLTAEQQAAAGAALGVAILYFRWVTTQPLTEK